MENSPARPSGRAFVIQAGLKSKWPFGLKPLNWWIYYFLPLDKSRGYSNPEAIQNNGTAQKF